jgi:hypothetical protein
VAFLFERYQHLTVPLAMTAKPVRARKAGESKSKA